jgi:hypothetical protein
MYEVYDHKTKQIIGTYKTLHAASNKANKLDLEYGAVRYGFRRVLSNP